jgi:hypothetical protein
MNRRWIAALACAALMGGALGCSRPSTPEGASAPSRVADAAGPLDAAGEARGAAVEALDAAASPPLPAGAAACAGAKGVTCVRFAKVEDAFGWVMALSPAVLAIGEAHAQKGTEGIASSTRRFTEAMLPMLEGRASDLLVEAWAGDPRCQREVKQVATAQRPVQQAQAQTNPNEYLTLGNRAKALGVQPHLLAPSCDDYASLADAGADTITASLELIKRLTQAQATQLFQRNAAAANGKVVVTYGGAMHNDLAPSDALRRFSFGPELFAATAGRYVELDLIVPEYVKKSEVWEKLPWFAAWQADTSPKDKPTLYRLGERSFVLLFSATPPAAPAPPR